MGASEWRVDGWMQGDGFPGLKLFLVSLPLTKVTRG